MSKKKLPKTVYVTWDEHPTADEDFLVADTNWEAHADMDGPRKVGVYQLVETIEVEAKPTKR